MVISPANPTGGVKSHRSKQPCTTTEPPAKSPADKPCWAVLWLPSPHLNLNTEKKHMMKEAPSLFLHLVFSAFREMAEVAVEYLVAKLEDWIFKETNKQGAAEVTKIKDEFNRIKPFLKYADWKRMIVDTDITDTCVTDVIGLACEVEDMIDDDYYSRIGAREFSLSSLVEMVGESLNYFMDSKTKYKSHPGIAFLHKRVTAKLKEVDVRKHVSLFGSLSENRDERHVHSQRFAENLPLTHMVGRDKEVKMLKDWLLEEDEDTPSLVAVTGIDGIGKTAVAATVYEISKPYFDCTAWVFVSGQPTIAILREMLMGFSRTPFERVDERYLDEMDEKELGKRVYNFLDGKKFLLVMDDLDTLDAWENLKYSLPMKCVGKVFITTRQPAFPAVLCKRVLQLGPLNPKGAFELIRRRAFFQHYERGEVPWSSSAEPTVEKILHFCEGHPLLVATVGGMIITANIEEPGKWEKILFIMKEAGECWPQFDMIQKVLVVSYFNLPPLLKCCLLYCAVFPCHYEISCKRLIRIWVAEGFIAKQLLGMTEEEIAKNLLEDLIHRNLLEVAKVGTNGEPISCRLLQLVQDFILKLLNKDHSWIMSNSVERIWSSEAIRVLAVHGVINNFVPPSNGRSIRSLLFFKKNGHSSPRTPSILLNSPLNIKFLRVLELQNSPIDALPDAVGNLVILRYISLRGTMINNLPPSLNSLHELQTLDIRDTNVRALPAGFDGLKMLRHLLLSGSFSKKVVKLNGDIMFYKDLQTLAGVKLTQQIALGLKYLPQLLKLSVGEVEGKENSLQLSKSIDQMKNLNSLTVKCAWRKGIQIQTSNSLENLEKLRVGGWVKDLLGWVSMLKSLKHLYLWDCMFTNDPISSLQQLPRLAILSLCNVYKGNSVCCGDSAGFPSLKKLSLVKFEELEEWTNIEDGSMKGLQTIIISKCPRLKQPPKGLKNLVDLQILQIKDMPPEFVREARELSLHAALHCSV
ncbi:hypothetical protein LguiA_017771 [Lonicera macranthoides]